MCTPLPQNPVMKIEMQNLAAFPTPLAWVLRKQLSETQPFRRVHRLIDTVEVLVKLHTVVIVSERFARSDDLSPEMRGMLAAGLRTPSLGIWWAFAREFSRKDSGLAENLEHTGGFHRAVSHKKSLLKREMDGGDNLIAFRNGYAHGATPEDAACQRDLDRIEPRLFALLSDAVYLREAEWVAVDAQGIAWRASGEEPPRYTGTLPPPSEPACYLRAGEQWIHLDPLLTRREEDGRFFFYNDLRKMNRAGFLNYEDALHIQDETAGDRLLQRYPIQDWLKTAPEDFRHRMEELTETFKGRQEELKTLLAFPMDKPSGFLMIWGGPGIGKSATLARLVQRLRLPEALRELSGESEATAPAGRLEVLEYFIRRGINLTDRVETLFDNLSQRLEQLWHTGVPLGSSAPEKAMNFQRRLRAIQERHLHSTDRLLLLIDGLDEADPQNDFFELLPKELPSGVLILYSSRPVPRVRERVYECLDREARRDMHLRGLTPEDVRAILSDSVSKYALEQNYIEQVARRSEGNPLYLNLLAQGLVSGDFQINDVHSLPQSMRELYGQALRRILLVPMAGEVLRLFATARDALNANTIAAMLDADPDRLRAETLPACMELLSELNPEDASPSYQLFHESLRDYLREQFPEEQQELEERLFRWCLDWERLRGEAQHYAFQHLPAHARACCRCWQTRDLPRLNQANLDLETLLASDRYRNQLYQTLNHCQPFQDLCQILLLHTLRTDPAEDRPQRAARNLCRLHLEPEIRYRETLEQVDTLRQAPPDPGRLLRLAAAGDSPRQRVFLLLRGLPPMDATDCPPEITQKIQDWCEQSRDTDLQVLCQRLHILPTPKRV